MFFESDKAKCKKMLGTLQAPTHDSKNGLGFFQQIREEARKLNVQHQVDIQSTLENPLVRELSDTGKISAELGEFKRQQFLDVKRRQQLRADNFELRQLEAQLRTAHVTSEQLRQRAQQERQKAEEQRQKQEEAKQRNALLQSSAQCAAEEAKREDQKKRDMRHYLQLQMEEHRKRRLREYEEVLRDKAERERIVQQLRAEDEAQRKSLAKRRDMERQEVAEYIQARELHKLQQNVETADEIERHKELQRERAAAERRKAEEKLRISQARTAQNDRIGMEVHRVEMEKRQRESLLTDLLVEERNALQDLRHRETLQRQKKLREQTCFELSAARDEKLEQRKRAKEMSEEDKLFFENQMRVFAEKDKLDQLSDERRRRCMQEHRRTLLLMMEERQNARLLKTAENIYEQTQMRKTESERMRAIDEERKRMICAQPVEVLQCLPRKALRPEELRKFLDRSEGCGDRGERK